jgi:uncharacterized protein YyaL (SSP411 family)
LHGATANLLWLAKAEDAASYIQSQFKSNESAYVTATGTRLKSAPQLDENIELLRFTNLLAHYTGKAEYRAMAEHAMHYLAVPALMEDRGYRVGGILLAENELAHNPVHVSVQGARQDKSAAKLFLAALSRPGSYKQTEWREPGKMSEVPGATPAKDYKFNVPFSSKATAFLCTDSSCSIVPEPHAPLYFASRQGNRTGLPGLAP